MLRQLSTDKGCCAPAHISAAGRELENSAAETLLSQITLTNTLDNTKMCRNKVPARSLELVDFVLTLLRSHACSDTCFT